MVQLAILNAIPIGAESKDIPERITLTRREINMTLKVLTIQLSLMKLEESVTKYVRVRAWRNYPVQEGYT
jgi:hypothetical protein